MYSIWCAQVYIEEFISKGAQLASLNFIGDKSNEYPGHVVIILHIRGVIIYGWERNGSYQLRAMLNSFMFC